MRKKYLLTVLLLVVLLFSASAVWAETGDSQIDSRIGKVDPAYTYATMIKPLFFINDGIATCGFNFYQRSGKDLDYIQATVDVKKSSGKIVKTFTPKIYPTSNPMKWRKTYQIPSRGTYYLKINAKCYKDGVVRETIDVKSQQEVY